MLGTRIMEFLWEKAIGISQHLSFCLIGFIIQEHLKGLFRLVMVTIVVFQLSYPMLIERKGVRWYCVLWFWIRMSLMENNRFFVKSLKSRHNSQSKEVQILSEVSNERIESFPKYLGSFRKFQTPKSATDIRSWFGLINRVSNYAKVRNVIAPFRNFLSSKYKFIWI